MTDRTAHPSGVGDKETLRVSMRAIRRSLHDRDERSEELWRHLIALPAMAAAETVLVFTTIPGEPDTRPLAGVVRGHRSPRRGARSRRRSDVAGRRGRPRTRVHRSRDRLGQGGGWYDRFLSAVRPDCVSIGVCFAEQLVDALPVEPHDVTMDHVVTDRGVAR